MVARPAEELTWETVGSGWGKIKINRTFFWLRWKLTLRRKAA